MEEISVSTLIIILIIMIILSAYFSASETGIMTINRYRLRHLAKDGNKAACRVESLLKYPDRLITLILISNNLINISASSLATILGMKLYDDIGVAVVTGILTFIIIFFAEMLPKTMAAIYPEKVAFFSSILLKPLQKITLPIVLLFNTITVIFMKFFGVKSSFINTDAISKDELRTIVNESKSKLSKRNQNMLISILDLDKITVGNIMVPRNEIFGIDINTDWKSIIKQLTHSPHGRIVLYRKTLDDIIGVLRVREAYRLMIEKNKFNKQNLIRAVDKIYFIPESTPLNIQLIKFQNNKEKIGIVVNEYGDIQGLITVEDILKEIVGDFSNSLSENLIEEKLIKIKGSVTIDGTTNIREINKILDWNLPINGARTINGLLLEELGDIPLLNTKIKINNYHFEVLSIDGNVIKEVKVTPVDI